MTIITVDDMSVPNHPDGQPWGHVLTLPDESTHYADTVTELLGAVLGAGYTDMSDDEALEARYEAALGMAAAIQTGLNQRGLASGDLNLATAGEAVLTALHVEKTQPWTGMPDAGFGDEARWEHAVPLVLVATDYHPYTSTPKPTGNISFIDPGTETTFLGSLNDLGLVRWSAYTGAD